MKNSQRPITNRPPDAIRPHMRSRQDDVFDRAGGALWGRQSCLGNRACSRLSGGSQTLKHWRSQRFFGVMSCRYRDVKPEKFVKGRASRLKAGCSQDWLPHSAAKPQAVSCQQSALSGGVGKIQPNR